METGVADERRETSDQPSRAVINQALDDRQAAAGRYQI
jgi:hypothetical protein